MVALDTAVDMVKLASGKSVEDVIIPNGFLRLSKAATRLEAGMWGGLPKSAQLRVIKPQHRWAFSMGPGPQKSEASKSLRTAAIQGKLILYVCASARDANDKFDPNPVALPTAVVSRLIRSRGSLPDHAIRTSLKIVGGNTKLLALLQSGVLMVRAQEFNNWYRSERAKRRWPSQRSSEKPREGRPSKQTTPLRNAVMSAMREKKPSIAALWRLLLDSGRTDVPSVDTLGRLVDQLFRETGEPEFRRTKRFRRKRS